MAHRPALQEAVVVLEDGLDAVRGLGIGDARDEERVGGLRIGPGAENKAGFELVKGETSFKEPVRWKKSPPSFGGQDL